MTSVVIAAHNEAVVIGRCLDALLAEANDGEFDVVVVANGCTDDTAAVAGRRNGVRIVQLRVASKPAALNAGDAAVCGFPRIYLDADVVLSTDSARALSDAVAGTAPVLAATPRRVLDLAGRPWPVLAYYAVNKRLPAFRGALFGRGAIALSAAGRARFTTFPDVVADDLFLDSLFAVAEKAQVDSARVRIATPTRTVDLVRRLARVRAGNAALRSVAAGSSAPRPAARMSWLRDVVLPRPWLYPAGACYAVLTAHAALSARRSAGHHAAGHHAAGRHSAGRRSAGGAGTWARDDSSRSAP